MILGLASSKLTMCYNLIINIIIIINLYGVSFCMGKINVLLYIMTILYILNLHRVL